MFLIFSIVIIAGYAFYYSYSIDNYSKPTADSEKSVPVSVIICAHTEYHNLQQLLPLVLSQNYPEYEIIVIDDRSTDETPALIGQWQTVYSQLRLATIRETPAGLNSKKYALSLGMRAARYDYFLLTDADCKPLTVNWIKCMQQGFSTGADIIIGYSPYLKIYGFLNYLIWY